MGVDLCTIYVLILIDSIVEDIGALLEDNVACKVEHK